MSRWYQMNFRWSNEKSNIQSTAKIQFIPKWISNKHFSKLNNNMIITVILFNRLPNCTAKLSNHLFLVGIGNVWFNTILVCLQYSSAPRNKLTYLSAFKELSNCSMLYTCNPLTSMHSVIKVVLNVVIYLFSFLIIISFRKVRKAISFNYGDDP